MNPLSYIQNSSPDIFLKILFFLLFIWSITWKGFALWRAASDKERNWFVAILILNTAGILEIAYLFFFAKNKLKFRDILLVAKSKISK